MSHTPSKRQRVDGTSGSSSRTNRDASSCNLSVSDPSATQPSGQLTPGHPENVIRAAFQAPKAALKRLGKSASAIPALGSAVDVIIDCLDNLSISKQCASEIEELMAGIATSVEGLEKHVDQLNTNSMNETIHNAIKKLTQEGETVQKMNACPGGKRYLDAERGEQELAACYRRIASAFQQLQVDVTLNLARMADDNMTVSKQSWMSQVLGGLCAVKNAHYNSKDASTVGRTLCTQGTRKHILEGLLEWANDPNGTRIYWMNGMAGTGKTTIAYTLCQQLESVHRLAASFFCSRNLPDCRDVSSIVPTIAYQMAHVCPAYRENLCKALEHDSHKGNLEVAAQFERLVRTPLRSIRASLPHGLLVVVLDALDECDRREDSRKVLDALLAHVDGLPIKFFVTCRPDTSLLNRISVRDDGNRSLYHLHDVEKSLVQADIEIYLREKLGSVGITENQAGLLASRAGKLFIFASTVVQYIAPEDPWSDHRERLDSILGMEACVDDNPYSQLDTLYDAVLSAAFDQKRPKAEIGRARQVLDTVICVKEPLTLKALSQLLQFQNTDQAQRAIEPLRAVLNVDQDSGLVSTLHASFPDYMLGKDRSGQFFRDSAEINRSLALDCFTAMKLLLRFNICNLESSYVLDSEVVDLSERIKRLIPLHLEYACKYWCQHATATGAEADASSDLGMALTELLHDRLLFWIEAINLLRANQAVLQTLQTVVGWMQMTGFDRELVMLCQDATRLLTIVSGNPVRQSTPHIYVSVLPLWSRSAPVWIWYGPRFRGLIGAKGEAIDGRASEPLVTWRCEGHVLSMAASPDGMVLVTRYYNREKLRLLEAHTGRVLAESRDEIIACSVAFAPNGSFFVSGSADGVIQIWDAETGNPSSSPITGHTSHIWSVCYFPDGKCIASGSADGTVRIWDASTGQQLRCWGGYPDGVYSVTYSPNGDRVVSGSGDGTIRVWDVHTGHLVLGPLETGSKLVQSVAYSPEGRRIISVGDDGAKVWDAATGFLVALSFEGDAKSITSLSYSPDGSHILAGSFDLTVRVWDAQMGSMVAGPFCGYDSEVPPMFILDGTQVALLSDDTMCIWDVHATSVAPRMPKVQWSSLMSLGFSPDSTRIVSGHGDGTVLTSDVQTGKLVMRPLTGHIGFVSSVAFSPCGRWIASGSWYGAVEIRDAETGKLIGQPYTGHSQQVNAVAFSPHGGRVASGSEDNTIQVWDTESKLLVSPPFQGHNSSVASLSFSPDGQYIASVSWDITLRMWNVKTGKAANEPFRGGRFAVAFSPDGRRVASDFDDYALVIRDARTGEIMIGPCKGHEDHVRCVVFSPNGHHLVSCSFDQSIRVWDAYTGGLVTCLAGAHAGWIRQVAFSPNGQLIASGSEGGSIRVWNARMVTSPTIEDCNWEEFDENGWVIRDDGARLFWVPKDLRVSLRWARNTCVISPGGEWELDLKQAYIGDDWAKCYASGTI